MLGLACVLGLSLTACPSDHPSGSGELGKADLRIVCTIDDAACESGEEVPATSVPIAVGASVDVAYHGPIPKSASGAQSTVILFSSSPAMLSENKVDHGFIAWAPGIVGLLARTDQATVLDFVHLVLADVARIELTSSSNTLAVGKEQVWFATPHGSETLVDSQGFARTVLAGTVLYTWEVDGPAVEIRSRTNRSVTLLAKEPGQATLRASVGSVAAESIITVEVAP